MQLMHRAETTLVPEKGWQAIVQLTDGSRFEGWGLGPEGIVSGEMVFTTAMTGYQEALTDPSYRGQVLLFTYPLIGNYGTAPGSKQSPSVHPRAVIVSTLSPTWSERDSLAGYLLSHQVPTVYGVDTRAMAGRIREHGAMPVAISIHRPGDEPSVAQLEAALQACAYDASNFVAETTTEKIVVCGYGRQLIALLDCGNKRRLVDELVRRGARVAVLPAHTPPSYIQALRPDGVVISNGPGNPDAAPELVATVRELYGTLPMLGICLGHQLLALAAGARTYKLKFGHRGANHPVQDCRTGQAFITTQNHGYAVDPSSLPAELDVSHRHLNDGTVEGLSHRSLPIRSVQFHPEGAPGPRDAGVIFDEWLEAAGWLTEAVA